MAGCDFLPRAMQIVKEAVEADNAQRMEEALSLYKRALGYFSTARKWEKNAKCKAAITQKMGEYMDRAEAISKFLKQQAEGGGKKGAKKKKGGGAGKKPKAVGAGGGGGDDDDDDDDDSDVDPETAKLQASLANAIVSETPNVKWSDVAGLEGAKSLLKEAVVLPVKFPQLFTGKRKPWKGILLYGPPGTGKSYLAKAVATEAGASCFLSVSSSDLVSKFQGESERLVKNLFELARAKSPSIIFIDEIDSLASARGDGENESGRRIKTEFLVQMQGVGKGNDGVLVLGATNTPWELDPAIRRRFEKRVYISLPDAQARATMFKVHIGDTPNNLSAEDYAALGEATDGFSGSDISVVVRDALYEPVRTCQLATHFKFVPNPDLAKPLVQHVKTAEEIAGSTGSETIEEVRAREAEELAALKEARAKLPPKVWVPCSPRDPAGKEMTLMDVPGKLLKPLDLCMGDFRKVLHVSKASVSPEDLTRLDEWTNTFGQEG